MSGFRPAALTTLRRLAKNNRKEWFEAHRPEIESEVLAPMRALVEELDVRLARVAPEIVGHPSRSIFRIYRDIRFSKDKSPYKTHVGAWFYHVDADPRQAKDAGAAGFYFHLEPGRSMVAAGIWMPAAAPLQKVREALTEDHRSFERIVRSIAFCRRYGEISDEKMLKRLPRGVPIDHPAGRWLRYQSFTAGRRLSDREVTRVDLPDVLARDVKALLPFVRWLNASLGFPKRARR
ncbi:MAG TPA: DUF2461 domain-containing protein [Gemmatimonadaceae bacterium]|nr:DUF2461 domain-containing protein [Gemmatimonadaceae bacterium]